MPPIASLTIIWKGQNEELPSPSFTAALAGWVALFPTLEHIHWGVKRDLEGSQAERNIAIAIINRCPRLKTLELLRDPPVRKRQPPPVDVWLRDGMCLPPVELPILLVYCEDPLSIRQLAWSQDIQHSEQIVCYYDQD